MIEIVATRPEVIIAAMQHDLSNSERVHGNLEAGLCCKATIVRRPPNSTGDTCANCGGMAVRTGSCTTCTECGTTGGCG